MCGIAGIVGAQGGALIARMTAALRHRGPDGTGHHSAGSAHVGATRLSIMDPAAHAQPVYNETGQICVVFNGEIYNHRELRAELQAKGHAFRTRTDTEVIVHLYEEMGDDCVRRLRGMFAFAILDGSRILLARDRLGIKPLYHAFLPGSQELVFASEIKALLRHPGLTPHLNAQTLADSLVLGYSLWDATLFEGVRSLPPGHTMAVSFGDAVRVEEPRRYWSRDPVPDEGMTLGDAEEALEAEMDRAVEVHLAADVDVALTLSGGLDSTMLALFAKDRLGRRMLTFTVGDHEGYEDMVHAGHVATLVGSEHHALIAGFDEYVSAIPDLIAAMEQPSGLPGLPFFLLCRKVAERAKACLHGEGADELFGGYPEYLDREVRLSMLQRRLPLVTSLGLSPSPRVLALIDQLSSATTFDDYLPRIFEINLADALERLHLNPVDRCSMAASLEMRVPYLDDGLVALVARMPLHFLVRADIGVKKHILRRIALKRFGLEIMDIVLRRKLGAPSAGAQLLARFHRLCEETLPDDYLTRHKLGGCFSSKRDLLLFEMFMEMFMKHRGDAGSIGSAMEFLRSRSGKSAAAKTS